MEHKQPFSIVPPPHIGTDDALIVQDADGKPLVTIIMHRTANDPQHDNARAIMASAAKMISEALSALSKQGV